MENNVNVCILARVSSKHQSVDSQVTSLQNYCSGRNYNVVKTITSTVTGNTTNKKRDDLIELMELVRSGNHSINKLCISELTRLGRRPNEIRAIVDFLHGHSISIVFVNLGLESLDADGKESLIIRLVIAIFSELAASEREILSDRIKAGLIHASKTKRLGRPVDSGEDDVSFLKKYKSVVKNLNAGLSIRKTSKLTGVSHTTIVKVKRLVAAA